ncbi:MAG: hypothetical protein MJZ12_03450 [Prevotella sp.]|nr:hypothetical protein [Prevotella sp.]
MKRIYVKPEIDIESIDMDSLLDSSMEFGGTGGGNNAESKQNSIFASFDLEDSDDNWGDIWADETEEY